MEIEHMKRKYLIIQTSILIVPPFLLSIIFPILSEGNFFQSFAGYSCGLFGLLVLFLISLPFQEDNAFMFIMYLLINSTIFISLYYLIISKNKYIKASYIINIILVIWKLVFGLFWMSASVVF